MDATARSYGSYGLALLTAAAITVAPVVATPAGVKTLDAAVQLTSSDIAAFDWGSLFGADAGQVWSNIGQNLLTDIINIPANWWTALNTYANAALGFPGITGTTDAPGTYDYQDPNGHLAQIDPDSAAPGADQGTLPTADTVYPFSAPIGPDGTPVDVGIGGTGSWWMESLGNTWGWDEGNFGQVLGLSNMIVPIPQFSTPFADELQAFAMQNIVADPQDCPFECPNILGYLGGWFHNLGASLTGTPVTVGETAGGDAISPMGVPISWAGDKVAFDPMFVITSFMNSLAANPDGGSTINGVDVTANGISDLYTKWFTDPGLFFEPFTHIVQDLFNDFNPLADGSFVYWGAPSMYTVPALVGGLIHSLTLGIVGNPMAQYTLAPGGAFMLEPYYDQHIVGGTDGTPETLDIEKLFPGITPSDYTGVTGEQGAGGAITAADLPQSLGAGMLYWTAGMLGYLDPYTYLGDLGVTAGTTESELTEALDKIGLGGLTDFIYDWHEGIDKTLIDPLQSLGNGLIPWYHDLTVGAGLDAFAQAHPDAADMGSQAVMAMLSGLAG